MLPVQDHLSVISSQYLVRALQLNNPSQSVVISSSGIRNMKQVTKSRFLHSVLPYLPSGILLPYDYMITIKSLHTIAVFDSKSRLSNNRAVQTASPQIAPEEANLPTVATSQHTLLLWPNCRVQTDEWSLDVLKSFFSCDFSRNIYIPEHIYVGRSLLKLRIRGSAILLRLGFIHNAFVHIN